ncbi:Ras GTPase [Pelomyxa schiedti]|nr:Ras GTPase [Pelomyxa schiedti]
MSEKKKLVVFGAQATGKSAMTVQFVQNFFINKYDPTEEDTYIKSGPGCPLYIHDIGGRDEVHNLHDGYMRDGDGFLLVYSITSRESFSAVNSYVDRLHQVRPAGRIPIVLCGNKCDLDEERQVTPEEGIALAKSIGCPFFETSASTPTNVDSAFLELVKTL